MCKEKLDIDLMKRYSKEFVKKRGWEKFQNPKNIAIGIQRESSELLEIFQWLTDKESWAIADDKDKMKCICDEIGDILHYIIRFANLLNIDLNKAFWEKMEKTEEKYPVKLCKGKSEKYSYLGLLNG